MQCSSVQTFFLVIFKSIICKLIKMLIVRFWLFLFVSFPESCLKQGDSQQKSSLYITFTAKVVSEH